MKNLFWTMMLVVLLISACQSGSDSESGPTLTDDEILAEIEMMNDLAEVSVPEGAYYYDLATPQESTKEYMAAL